MKIKRNLKTTIKYAFLGVFIGIFLIVLSYIISYTIRHKGNNFLILLFYIPNRVYTHFFPCPYTGLGCLYYGLDIVTYLSPIYLGILGFLIGLLVEKLRKKK